MTELQPFMVGDWLVEPSLDRISRDGEVRNLRPQVMELLVFLAARRGEVAGTEQLLTELWDGRIVAEGSVYNCVSELRIALAIDGEATPAIETIPKKGYRLVAPVTAPDTDVEASRPRLMTIAVVLTALAAIALAAVWLDGSYRTGGKIRSLAVLPLDNHSSNPARDAYFTDGMTEALIARLSRIRGLDVISRTSAMHLKGSDLSVPEIARKLDVDGIVEGSVLMTEAEEIRITLQLIDGKTDKHLWTRSYVRNAGDVIQLQEEVSNAIAAELYQRLANPADDAPEAGGKPPTTNDTAYRAWLKGRYAFNRFGEENFRAALDHYDEAIELDPAFALAYASRAEACLQPVVIVKRILTQDDCYRAARRATELDDALPEGHAALGYIQLFRWEWADAEASLSRAVELDPNSVMARQWRTLMYRTGYRFEEALQEIRYAEQRDPLNLFIKTMVSWPLYDMRRYQEALEQLDEVLAVEPAYMLAHYNRGLVFIEQRDAERVFSVADRVAEIGGEQSLEARLLRASGHAIDGEYALASEIIDAVERDGGAFMATWIASIYLIMGEQDAALARLERGVAERAVDMPAITEPRFDAVRQHPRFRAVSRQMGLPDTG